jgi:outer membrane protein FlgP
MYLQFFKRSVLLASYLLLISCSSIYNKHVQWQTVKPESYPVLKATGYAPISLQKSTNKTQRMLMAINASKLSAYAELAEQVYGQQVSNSTTMSDLIIENQSLRASVQGVIRGAKVVASYPVGDTYTTELSLDFKDVFELYESTQHKREIKSVDYY